MKKRMKIVFALLAALAVLLQPLAAVKAADDPAPKVTKKTLYVGGDNYKISFKNLSKTATVKYSSSNTKVAKVTSAGVIKPVAKGKATVTVKITQSKKTYTSKIAVTVMNPYVKITNPVTTLTVGDTYKFEAKTYGLKKTSTTWTVSDKTVGTINAKTRVFTALKAGTVKVTFKDTISKKSNSVTITVEPKAAAEDLPEDELYGYEVEDGGAVITEVYDSEVTSLDIPKKLGGYPVTAIGDSAFEGLYELKSVKMPSTVTQIGDYAFGSCESLTSVTIPSGVTRIGDSAFEYCTALTKLTLPQKLNEMGYNMFEGCEKLASIEIPAGVEVLPDSSFTGCTALKTVTFHEGLTEIGEYAFEACTSVSALTFPKSLKVIYGYAFSGCGSLAKVTFSSGLEEIEDGAFENCVKLTGVTLPGTLTYLGSGAFAGCEKLTGATVPKSVEDIGSGVFDDCSESFKLKVKKNSYAYEYAVDEEIPYTTY